MTKHVFSPSSMVAHVWAQRSQDWGRSSHGNLSFQGNTLFSYAQPIATFMDVMPDGGRDENGGYIGTVVLIDNGSWSITTSKHQSEARGATRNVPGRAMFHAPNRLWRNERHRIHPSDDFHANMLSYFLQEAGELHAKAKRARKNKDWHIEAAMDRLRDYRRWATIWKLDAPDLSLDGLNAELARMAEEAEELRKVRLAEEAEREAKVKARELDYQRNWINDQTMWTQGMSMIPVAMRLRASGNQEPDFIETSWGATFPLDHAVKAFPLLLRLVGGVEVPEHFPGYDFFGKDTTIRLGHFRIDKIARDGTIHAGCHRVPWSEVIRLARILNLVKEG